MTRTRLIVNSLAKAVWVKPGDASRHFLNVWAFLTRVWTYGSLGCEDRWYLISSASFGNRICLRPRLPLICPKRAISRKIQGLSGAKSSFKWVISLGLVCLPLDKGRKFRSQPNGERANCLARVRIRKPQRCPSLPSNRKARTARRGREKFPSGNLFVTESYPGRISVWNVIFI